MAGYGMKGEMNPQSKQKANMSNSSKMKKSDYAEPGQKKYGSNDMSPACKKADEEAVWQNMRG